ncbi:MAG: hypothetical protein QNJ44_13260 [Rhodobacter sp.]|nr:hypothetical protein [Rhodobacter sp.]
MNKAAPDTPGTGTAAPPDEIVALMKAHSSVMARYDALTFLRNALTLANAGFGQALVQAGSGEIDRSKSTMLAAQQVLAASISAWQAVDADSESTAPSGN